MNVDDEADSETEKMETQIGREGEGERRGRKGRRARKREWKRKINQKEKKRPGE